MALRYLCIDLSTKTSVGPKGAKMLIILMPEKKATESEITGTVIYSGTVTRNMVKISVDYFVGEK